MVLDSAGADPNCYISLRSIPAHSGNPIPSKGLRQIARHLATNGAPAQAAYTKGTQYIIA